MAWVSTNFGFLAWTVQHFGTICFRNIGFLDSTSRWRPETQKNPKFRDLGRQMTWRSAKCVVGFFGDSIREILIGFHTFNRGSYFHRVPIKFHRVPNDF